MKDVVVKSIVWMGGSSLITQLVTWLSTILVARILNPSDYGLIALAGTYICFADQLNEFGVGTVLVQRKDLNEDDIKGIFTISILIGLIMTVVTFMLSPLFAKFFNDERLVWIIRWLSLSFLINGAKTVQRNLMMREMRFTELAKAESGSRILTSAGALSLAYCGFGVWVLVIQSIIQNLVMFIWCFVYERRLPGRIHDFTRMRDMLSFGGSITMVNLFYSAYRSFDPLIVGKLLGQSQLGYYSFAQTLADKPFEKILSIFTQVFFPIFSRIQDDTNKMKTYWFSVIEKELFMFTPVFVGLIIISPELVQVILGNKWAGMVLPLQVFSAIAILRYFSNRINLVYVSLGMTKAQFYFVLCLCLVMPVSLYVGGHFFDMRGVLASWLLVYPLLCIVYFIVFMRFWNLNLTNIGSILSCSFWGTCSMLVSVSWLHFMNESNPFLLLILKVLLSGVTYFLVTYLINRNIFLELLSLLRPKKVLN